MGRRKRHEKTHLTFKQCFDAERILNRSVISEQEYKSRVDFANDCEMLTCTCFDLSGYYISYEDWCDCLGPNPHPFATDCSRCTRKTVRRNNYKGNRILCIHCLYSDSIRRQKLFCQDILELINSFI